MGIVESDQVLPFRNLASISVAQALQLGPRFFKEIRLTNTVFRPRACHNIHINKLRPRQKGRHFDGDIFKCISVDESVWMSIKISMILFPMVENSSIGSENGLVTWSQQAVFWTNDG